MSAHTSPNFAFNAAANSAEGMRQTAVSTAAGSGATLQANVRAAEVTYYRACYSAALANNIAPGNFLAALRSLGQYGG
jgi:hypothetical protein